MKKRLARLEAIMKQKTAGNNEEYLKAIQREMDRIRTYIENQTQGNSSILEPPNEKDLETIKQYELIYPVPEDTGARERIEKEFDMMHEKLTKGV